MSITVDQVDSAILNAKTTHESRGKKFTRQKRYRVAYEQLNVDKETYKKISSLKLVNEKEFPDVDEWKQLGDAIKLVYGIYETSSE